AAWRDPSSYRPLRAPGPRRRPRRTRCAPPEPAEKKQFSGTDTMTDTSTAAPQERVKIFDTTMRDGELSPGASMTLAEKLQIARILDEMGVDIIEAGFPIASEGDFQAVTEVSKIIENATDCGLSRSGLADIDRAWEALQHARKG